VFIEKAQDGNGTRSVVTKEIAFHITRIATGCGREPDCQSRWRWSWCLRQGK